MLVCLRVAVSFSQAEVNGTDQVNVLLRLEEKVFRLDVAMNPAFVVYSF